tara:strand:- start:1012 stop:1290 length:279 start_codon:yes stop_codon:yes gene_type:complete
MIWGKPVKVVGIYFLLLGVLEISLLQFCLWMWKTLEGSESGYQYLFSIVYIICELFYLRLVAIIQCSIGALLLIIHMVKKNMHTEHDSGRKQ